MQNYALSFYFYESFQAMIPIHMLQKMMEQRIFFFNLANASGLKQVTELTKVKGLKKMSIILYVNVGLK